MKKIYITGTVVFLVILSIFLIFILPMTIKSLKKPYPIISTIKINNLCSVHDDAFMVVTRPYNRKSFFSNGVSRIKVMSDWKVRLEANVKYPEFRYDGNEVNVKENIELTADCGTSTRLKSIFGAFNKQFN
tara:strand:+ start:87 stop:479 length:393 start_codon:yes stop_codon:yes gene_type:complete